MVEIYKTDNKVLQKLDNIEEGCWVNMIDPTSSELSLVSGYFEIDLADLATALDVFVIIKSYIYIIRHKIHR